MSLPSLTLSFNVSSASRLVNPRCRASSSSSTFAIVPDSGTRASKSAGVLATLPDFLAGFASSTACKSSGVASRQNIPSDAWQADAQPDPHPAYRFQLQLW